MTGTPEGFMEKPGIEPATPGLQGIKMLHFEIRYRDMPFCSVLF